MKKKFKLLITAAALGLSAVSVATGTYAWWTLNTETDSDGLSIEAVTPTALYIRESLAAEDNDVAKWLDKITFGYSGENMPAVGYSEKKLTDDKELKFYKIDEGKVSLDGTVGGKRKVDDILALTNSSSFLTEATGGKTYTTQNPTDYFAGSIDLILSSAEVDATAKIYATVAVEINVDKFTAAGITNPTEAQIKKAYGAVHVGLLTTEYTAGVASKTWTEFDFSDFKQDDTDKTLFTITKMNGADKAPIINALGCVDDEGKYIGDNTKPATVQIYIWYDGTDTQCTNDSVKYAGMSEIVVKFESENN